LLPSERSVAEPRPNYPTSTIEHPTSNTPDCATLVVEFGLFTPKNRLQRFEQILIMGLKGILKIAEYRDHQRMETGFRAVAVTR